MMRRKVGAAATAVALMATVAACSSGDSSTPTSKTSSSSIAAHPVAGFQDTPLWRQNNAAAGQSSAVMSDSDLVTLSRSGGGVFHVQGRDVSTGQVQWSSDDAVFPAGSSQPSLSLFGVDAHSYAVTQRADGDGVHVDVFDADGSTMSEKPVVAFTVAKGARVGVSPYGVLVTGDQGQMAQYVVDAVQGKKVPYGGSPRVGQGSGTPVAAGPGGTYVTDYGADGFGVAAQGSTYGWSSKSAAQPAGIAGGQAGSLLSTNGHLIVSKWSATGGKGHVLAVQDANDGRVIFSGSTSDDPSAALDVAPVMSTDGDYVVWGEHVFDRSASQVRTIGALDGVRVSFVARGHAYGVRADGKGVSIDLRASSPTAQVQNSEPVGLTHDGIGVFVDSGSVYAQPLS